MTDAQALRHQLRAAGYAPIPLFGKTPPIYGKNNQTKGLKRWQEMHDAPAEQIDLWSKTWPDAINTGCLCRFMPTLDLDILSEDAVRALVDHVREHHEERGYILPRIGKPPKCAIPFRTEEPFKKIVVNLIAADGSEGQKIEVLADGEQVVVNGIHPDTRQPYHWPRGEPGPIKLEDLPYIREAAAGALVEELVGILVRDFGYQRAASRPQQRQKTDSIPKLDGGQGKGESDWTHLYDNIREGRELHDTLRTLAAKMIACGTNSGATINQLRSLMEGSKAPKDDRWRARVSEIPAAVDSAVAKYGKQPEPEPAELGVAEEKPPASGYTIDNLITVFEKWILKDHTPIYAMLGTVAANLLPGDPVWLGLVAPPSSAKTELLNSIAGLPHVVQAATITCAALLSGTPKKQQASAAKGGLLRQIGSFGFLLLKDFGSILSMRPDAKAEVLAALREVFDGAWTRHLGTDGGKTLAWKGKVGLVFGVTGVIDAHYAVIGTMGDRYLLCRLRPEEGQLKRALAHVGDITQQMRKELADTVSQLFAAPRREPQPLTDDEYEVLNEVCSLVVRLRGAVDRDRISREIEAVYGAEGTARIGLCLERLLAGLDSLGVDRQIAFGVVTSIALDSVPPLRRSAYEYLRDHRGEVKTPDIAAALGLPTNTVRRALEDLTAYHLVTRISGGKGKPDSWLFGDSSRAPQTRVL